MLPHESEIFGSLQNFTSGLLRHTCETHSNPPSPLSRVTFSFDFSRLISTNVHLQTALMKASIANTTFVYEFHALIRHVRVLPLPPDVVSHINKNEATPRDTQAAVPKPEHKRRFIEMYVHERNHSALPANSKPTCFLSSCGRELLAVF